MGCGQGPRTRPVRGSMISEPAQARRRYPDSNRVRLGKALGISSNPGDIIAVLLNVCGDLIGGRRVWVDARLASDDNNIAAASITIKVQRYFGIMLNVP